MGKQNFSTGRGIAVDRTPDSQYNATVNATPPPPPKKKKKLHNQKNSTKKMMEGIFQYPQFHFYYRVMASSVLPYITI